MLEAALAYGKRGWPIFPVKPLLKTPLTANGVLDATTNLNQIERWWDQWPEANVALDVGSASMMVLDLDPGHDAGALDEAVGGLPETRLRARTPRGGEHLYFILDRDEVVAPSASKLAPHVDVRSFHSYVLLPPSRTVEGSYKWEGEGRPARRTDEMVRLANSAREKSEDRDEWIIEPDLPEHVERAEKWLRREAKIAVEGEGGDACAYATAARMKSYGISEETAFELIWEHWNPRCDPPWGEDEEDHLRQKVENAYAYNTSPPGNMTAAYREARAKTLFKPYPATENGEPVNDPDTRYRELIRYFVDVLTASGERQRLAVRFGDIEIAPSVPWIIDGWLPQDGVAILYGESESFKTYMSIHALLCVATGRPYASRVGFEGYAVGNPREVVLFAGESFSGVVQRINAAIEGDGFDRKLAGQNLVVVRDVYSLNHADGLAGMADEIDALDARPAIVAVDTLNLALDGNEDSAEDVKRALRGLRALVSRFGAAGLLIDHVGHGDKARPRGSSAKKANADVMILCERDDNTRMVTLTQTKNRDDDPTKYRTAFCGETVKLGTSATNLHFRAIEPRQSTSEHNATRQLFERDIHARHILAALRSIRGRRWKLRELAEEARRKGCTIPFDTLRQSVLTTRNGKRGWALDHTVLAPYRDPYVDQWITPPKLGPIDPRWALENEDYQ